MTLFGISHFAVGFDGLHKFLQVRANLEVNHNLLDHKNSELEWVIGLVPFPGMSPTLRVLDTRGPNSASSTVLLLVPVHT